ncbi:hypothetical protein FRX31_007224 [Thalictrum thalictroides]|uniref:Uncharacterized protein n=1 Tax=Thalictrum thalictroides TaxID=46969 RepID=A0A7J6X0D0_THATH|nr:hypothetical protein FRX31_007224 [Thalictrum thalictroides]
MKSRADEEAEERGLALYRSSLTKPPSTKPCGVMTLYKDVDHDFSEGQKSPANNRLHNMFVVPSRFQWILLCVLRPR